MSAVVVRTVQYKKTGKEDLGVGTHPPQFAAMPPIVKLLWPLVLFIYLIQAVGYTHFLQFSFVHNNQPDQSSTSKSAVVIVIVIITSSNISKIRLSASRGSTNISERLTENRQGPH